MTSILCILITALAIVAGIILWATESPQQRAKRWHQAGRSYRAIGQALGVSHTTARRWTLG